MAITQAIANSFKKQLLEGDQNFSSGGDVFKLALYTSAATLNSSTTVISQLQMKLLTVVHTHLVVEL
jgi:hypothetical protein